MSRFDPRPKGTLISGTFEDGVLAERALRVLRNAGYARAEVVSNPEALPGAPVVLVIDAAATGAARAAEILEAHGAQTSVASAAQSVAAPKPPAAASPSQSLPQFERKPRARKKNRNAMRGADMPPRYEDIIIVTRGIESFRNDATAGPP